MSTVFPEAQASNIHLKLLQTQVDQFDRNVDCLIIGHNDPEMITRLKNAKKNNCVAVSRTTQSEWDSCLPEIVGWAADAGIDEVLIVGHSHGYTPTEESSLDVGSTDRIQSGIRRYSYEISESRRHFARQMANLIESDELKDKECSDNFRLLALYFIAESGSFVRYNISSETFEPIV